MSNINIIIERLVTLSQLLFYDTLIVSLEQILTNVTIVLIVCLIVILFCSCLKPWFYLVYQQTGTVVECNFNTFQMHYHTRILVVGRHS